ncbi:hypothetical protein DPX39_100012600 [Trypanosoma brucei equiperdum]|uniref:Phytanoyl-CoA dioxygenase (PhyH) n=1 Tax=Trypanosoma brucei equiperdum TaxID=630700 RepID=A0A3L6KXL7_9TRYP|nr:hypothetical protein DPX39_100012600 [Trypanosoma brucei equiperdum]
MQKCLVIRHGRLRFPLGNGSTSRYLTVGRDLLPLIPSNEIYHDPPKLRHRLDRDGYLYFKSIVPRVTVSAALDNLRLQMTACGWTCEEDHKRMLERSGGVALGLPFPSTGKLPPPQITYTDSLRAAVSGTSVMALVRQVFGGAVRVWDIQSVHLAAPQESFGLRMPSVYMNRGTKLAIIALVPLHDTPMHMGTPVIVKGSNSSDTYAALRSSYGQHDVEGDDICGDGCYTDDPDELLPLGKQLGIDEVTGRRITVDVNPFLSVAVEPGDVILLTVYTMHSFLTNTTDCWRIMTEAVWTMEGDDVGPDPRYVGSNAPGLNKWYSERDNRKKYPRTMNEAKKAWGLVPDAPSTI